MITIIGAGPIGSHAARLLAEKGEEVQVIEEHKEIGKPVQCTGIVTNSISDIIKLDNKFVINRLKKVIIHAPNNNTAEIKINDIVIDRTRFDNHLATLAVKKGAKYLLGKQVIEISKSENSTRLKIYSEGKTGYASTDKLVGADGPNSIVSDFIGNKKPDCWIGLQAVVNMPVDKTAYSVYFSDYIPGFFGWVVPENETTARVGIATTKNPKLVFQKFMERLDKPKMIEMQGGLIPKYNPRMTLQADNTYLVGDAATQVKATTGGGIVPGMKAAECLARAILNKTSYKKELKIVDRDLKTSLVIRNMLDRFNEKDYDKLISIVDAPKLKKILNKHDRDNPSKLLFKSLIAQPKLLFFASILLRAKRL